MREHSLEVMEQAALVYQDLMVPALFEQWTDPILKEAGLEASDKVLDVACGSGILARNAAGLLNEQGYIAGLDMNPGMLSIAKKLSPEIDWRQGDAENIPWEDGFFDKVVSQFGLMFFEDQVRALKEMQRVLSPNGSMVVAVFDALERNIGYELITGLFNRIAGEEVANALRFPFSLGNRDKLEYLCHESGMASAEITRREGKAVFADVRSMILADVKGWFPLADITLKETELEEIIRQGKTVLQEFVKAGGRIEFPLNAWFISYQK